MFHSCPWFDGLAGFDSACAECKAAELAPDCSDTCHMAAGHQGPCNWGVEPAPAPGCAEPAPAPGCANPWCATDALDWECPYCHASAWKS